VIGGRDGALVIAAPNEAQRSKCQQHQTEVEAAVAKVVGSPVKVVLVVDGSAIVDDNVVPFQRPAPAPVVADDDVDLTDLVDVPPEAVVTPADRLLQAFPGSQFVEE
jgi:DNA polymerase-3 subunit gamma/tau